MNYILDTNVIINLLRDHEGVSQAIKELDVFSEDNTVIVSVVTTGELESFAIRKKWGKKKLEKLHESFLKLFEVPIKQKDMIKSYGQIDAFSQGAIEVNGQPLGSSAKNMGKNDLWIAATAHVTNSILITSDKDFSHLDGVFFDVHLIKL